MCYEQKHKEEPLQALPCDRNQDIEEEVDPDLVDTINYALRWKQVSLGSNYTLPVFSVIKIVAQPEQ